MDDGKGGTWGASFITPVFHIPEKKTALDFSVPFFFMRPDLKITG